MEPIRGWGNPPRMDREIARGSVEARLQARVFYFMGAGLNRVWSRSWEDSSQHHKIVEREPSQFNLVMGPYIPNVTP